jgi:uncharacterized protein (DUF58 family)
MSTDLSSNMENTIRLLPLNDTRLQHILLERYRKSFPGTGVEFDELQPYTNGDDVRTIDWKASVRMNSMFVQKYTQTFDNKILLAVDTSSSMNTVDAQGNPKLQTALAVLFTIAQTAFTNGDKVGAVYHGTDGYVRLPFTGSPASLLPTLNKIENTIAHSFLEENDWDGFFDYLMSHIKERTVCFIVSDNFDFRLKTISKLKLASLKHTLIFIEISNWFDELDASADFDLVDIETNDTYEPFLYDQRLVEQIKQEMAGDQAAKIHVTLNGRFFKVSGLHHVTYDMIRLLGTRQVKFVKEFTP